MSSEVIMVGRVVMLDKENHKIRFKCDIHGRKELSYQYSIMMEEKLLMALQDEVEVMLVTSQSGWVNKIRFLQDSSPAGENG